MLMSLIHNGLSPTAIFLSASTISNKKSPVLRLSFSAVRTRFELALERVFTSTLPPGTSCHPLGGTEVAGPNLPLRLDHQQQKKPSPSTELLCGADEIRTRDLRRDRPAF